MSKFIRDLGVDDPSVAEALDMLMHRYTHWIMQLLDRIDGDPLVEIERVRSATLQDVKNLAFEYRSEREEVQIIRLVVGVLEHTFDAAHESFSQPPRDYD